MTRPCISGLLSSSLSAPTTRTYRQLSSWRGHRVVSAGYGVRDRRHVDLVSRSCVDLRFGRDHNLRDQSVRYLEYDGGEDLGVRHEPDLPRALALIDNLCRPLRYRVRGLRRYANAPRRCNGASFI
jgi:hypothetical protein